MAPYSCPDGPLALLAAGFMILKQNKNGTRDLFAFLKKSSLKARSLLLRAQPAQCLTQASPTTILWSLLAGGTRAALRSSNIPCKQWFGIKYLIVRKRMRRQPWDEKQVSKHGRETLSKLSLWGAAGDQGFPQQIKSAVISCPEPQAAAEVREQSLTPKSSCRAPIPSHPRFMPTTGEMLSNATKQIKPPGFK